MITTQDIDSLLTTPLNESSSDLIKRWNSLLKLAVNFQKQGGKLTKYQEEEIEYIQFKLDDWNSDYEICE